MSRARTRRRHVEVEQPQRRRKRGESMKKGPFLLMWAGTTTLMTVWLNSNSTSRPDEGGLLALAVGSGAVCVVVVFVFTLLVKGK